MINVDPSIRLLRSCEKKDKLRKNNNNNNLNTRVAIRLWLEWRKLRIYARFSSIDTNSSLKSSYLGYNSSALFCFLFQGIDPVFAYQSATVGNEAAWKREPFTFSLGTSRLRDAGLCLSLFPFPPSFPFPLLSFLSPTASAKVSRVARQLFES